MHMLMAIYGRPADPAAFKAHYEAVHLPIAERLPGVVDVVHTFDVTDVTGGDAFCVFTAVFRSRADLEAAMASEIGQELERDVPNYATGGIRLLILPKLTGG